MSVQKYFVAWSDPHSGKLCVDETQTQAEAEQRAIHRGRAYDGVEIYQAQKIADVRFMPPLVEPLPKPLD